MYLLFWYNYKAAECRVVFSLHFVLLNMERETWYHEKFNTNSFFHTLFLPLSHYFSQTYVSFLIKIIFCLNHYLSRLYICKFVCYTHVCILYFVLKEDILYALYMKSNHYASILPRVIHLIQRNSSRVHLNSQPLHTCSDKLLF